MLKAFKSVLQILVLGFFRLPIRIWLNSKNKLIAQYGREESIYEVLDDEYMATNWLDWAVDCGIFMIYPIGFSAIIKAENKKSKLKWLNAFNSIWISAEVFNLLDINNTVSYLWVADVSGREYAVPNYLTARQLNAKLILSF